MTTQEPSGTTALVTGASRGFGRDIAVALGGGRRSPAGRLAELGVAAVSLAGFLIGQLSGAHAARLSEIATEVAAIA